MEEVWKDIKGYEGLYQVSNLGRVKSFGKGGFNQFQNKERFLSVGKNSCGYGVVVLVFAKIKKTFSVHRLVALHFLSNKLGKKVVNHKDGDKLNNSVFNLEWVSYQENNKHARDVLGCYTQTYKPQLGLKGGLSPFSKVVCGYSKSGVLLYRFNAVTEVKQKGFTPSLVASCARGEQSHHKNIIWKYI